MRDSRGWLVRFGILAIAAVAAGVLTSGLPRTAAGRALLLGLLAVAVAGWLAGLSGRLPLGLFAAVTAGTGLAGAALNLVHPAGPGFVIGYMALGPGRSCSSPSGTRWRCGRRTR